MGYAVELKLETVAAEPIRNLFVQTDSLMTRIGASPHVSLGVCLRNDQRKSQFRFRENGVHDIDW
jgi:hypothetical protein